MAALKCSRVQGHGNVLCPEPVQYKATYEVRRPRLGFNTETWEPIVTTVQPLTVYLCELHFLEAKPLVWERV